MIVDSSVLVSILCREPGYEAQVEKVATAGSIAIAAPTVLETALVLTSKLNQDGLAVVHEFAREAGAAIVSFTEQHASLAYAAYRRYGKGRHAAGLNFGDCMSYAVAKAARQPLLFVGEDFTKTDIHPA
jgi:ribonuclease VapC